ncbi:MAG: hypothetical protein K2K60_04805 [Clostridia bacterium]|nr:hypothetical protein [Clostridia bacterium]
MLHDGHRKRICARLEDENSVLYDHEVVEMLLFNAFQRKNTNPLAHALLDRFCTIHNIVNASVEELMTVEGIGEQTAYYIRVVGQCLKRIKEVEGLALLKNFGDCKKLVSMRLRGKSEEHLELYFTEKSGRVFRVHSFTTAERNRVTATADEIVRAIALAKPHGILVAHNHLNGNHYPSDEDDVFTKEMQLICCFNNVQLLDHIIYAGDDNIFSYQMAGVIDRLRTELGLENVIKWIKDLN